jgi:vacuolar protein sorting-associated protein 16
VQYNYDEPIKLIPECDGVRILSNSSMEFLHRVPDCTTLIFGIGSMSPAALLYDARDHYDRQSAKVLFYNPGNFCSSILVWINSE